MTLERCISYYYQMRFTVDALDSGGSVLEIGIGNGLVSAWLRQLGYQTTTCDFDATVKPDLVADVRKLPLSDGQFNLVMACQILEHLPWQEFDVALRELARVSNKYVLVSLPRRHTGFECVLKFPGIRALIKRNYLTFFLEWPLRFPGFAESGQHYWEIDTWQVSMRDVREQMEKYFFVQQVLRPPLNRYHVFFLLEKRV